MKTIKKLLCLLLLTVLSLNCNIDNNKVIKIGAILPLTGDAAEYGNDQKAGIEMAFENFIDSLKNTNTNVDIFYEDSKSNSKEGINAYNKLKEKGVHIYFTTLSNVSMALASQLQKDKDILITIAAHPELTKNYNNVIRMLPTSDYYAKILSIYVAKYQGKPDISIIYSNDDFGISFKDSFKSEYILNQGVFNSIQPFEKDKLDYRTDITKLLKNSPQAIFAVGYGKDLGNIIKQIRIQGYEGEIYGTPEISYPDVKNTASEYYNNIFFVTMKIDEENDLMQNFINRYSFNYKRKSSLDSYLGYDETSILLRSLMNINSSISQNENTDLIKALKTVTNNYSGLTGKLKIDDSGNVLFPLKVNKIEKGKEIDQHVEL